MVNFRLKYHKAQLWIVVLLMLVLVIDPTLSNEVNKEMGHISETQNAI